MDISLLETDAEKADLGSLLVERWSDREGGVLELLFYSKYRPCWTSPTPIVLQQERSWMKQDWDKNTRQKGKLWVSWLADTRLKEKEGTQRTCLRISELDSLTVPMWVTWVDSTSIIEHVPNSHTCSDPSPPSPILIGSLPVPLGSSNVSDQSTIPPD